MLFGLADGVKKVEKAHGYRRYLRDEMNWVEGNNAVFIFDEGQPTGEGLHVDHDLQVGNRASRLLE